MKLAECLLRRKELQQKLDRMQPLHANPDRFFQMSAQRVPIAQGVDLEEIRAKVPKVTLGEFDAEYNHYARQLRLLDAAIQQANWTSEIAEVEKCFKDYIHRDL